MASTYTTSLKIQEIGTGDQSGTWGNTTNTNWTLIEQAVAGVVNIPMTNANYTMTNLNGVSDEARNMVLNVTGTNSGIYQVVAPLVPKFYIVSNNTTGGYAIQIGASTGSIITIPNGVTAQVYCDGSTGFFSAQTGSAGNFIVNGTLTATGVTDTGVLTASSVTAGSLTISGTAAFTNTTASSVFSASPLMPTPSSSDNSTKGATTAFVQTALSGATITGQISMWPTTSAPSGYLLCDGSAVSRTTYSALYGVVGTTFGSGDGSTTFNLPNYTDRMPIGKGTIAATIGATGGSSTTTLSTSNLPAHSHSASVTDPGHYHHALYNGAYNGGGAGAAMGSSGNSGGGNVSVEVTNISVSIGNTGSGTAATTISPYLGISFIIKT